MRGFDAWVGSDHGPDDVGPPEHGGREDVDPGTRRDEHLSDFTPAGVGRRAQAGFKVAKAPIPSGMHQARPLGEHLANHVDTAVARADKVAHARAMHMRELVHHD